jgi:membrane associated rhomboid family serine protease
LIPLRDENPTVLWPVLTISFISANVLVFLYQVSLLSVSPRSFEAFVFQLGIVPSSLVGGHVRGAGGYYTVFTSMFLHGDWMHLGGNMLYLWIFGNNVEDSMGHSRFVVFYLMAGLAAALIHIVLNPSSTVPTIGASGAVSGVLGAYLILYPRARILTLIPLGFYLHWTYLPAWFMLVVWIGFQLLYQALSPINPAAGGVAYAAHIGGFVAGIVLIPFFRKYRRRTHFRRS